uniref:Uncharacterized protein n=1 Tax=Sus scrofa TaxID=9823 RepID=A0A8D0ZBT5_PIG
MGRAVVGLAGGAVAVSWMAGPRALLGLSWQLVVGSHLPHIAVQGGTCCAESTWWGLQQLLSGGWREPEVIASSAVNGDAVPSPHGTDYAKGVTMAFGNNEGEKSR